MFPFSLNNGYQESPFDYNYSQDASKQPQFQRNPFSYPFLNLNFVLQHQNTISSFFSYPQMPYFLSQNQSYSYRQKNDVKKTRRITRKLSLIKLRNKKSSLPQGCQIERKNFKYFDPSRAPPISTLRNSQQLQLDRKLREQQYISQCSKQQKLSQQFQQTLMKLQILLKEPDNNYYPFLICKRRKYHRNLKRRYSVAYFEQRAGFINNKQPIPPSLYPKNKVRKPRQKKNNYSEDVQCQQSQISCQFVSSCQQNDKMMSQSEKIVNVLKNVEENSQKNLKLAQKQSENEAEVDNQFKQF